MRIVGADVDAAVALQFLEPDPDVGLYVFDQVSDVYMSVSVRQCAGNEELSHGGVFYCV